MGEQNTSNWFYCKLNGLTYIPIEGTSQKEVILTDQINPKVEKIKKTESYVHYLVNRSDSYGITKTCTDDHTKLVHEK